MQTPARPSRTAPAGASVGWLRRASETCSIRTSLAPYMRVVRMAIYLRSSATLTSSRASEVAIGVDLLHPIVGFHKAILFPHHKLPVGIIMHRRPHADAARVPVHLSLLPADHWTAISCLPAGTSRAGWPTRSTTTGTGESTVTLSTLASTAISPCGVGTLPFAHARRPRRGAIRALA